MWKEIISITKPYYNEFNNACKIVKKYQDRLLDHIIENNRATAFAKKHQFNKIYNYSSFHQHLPLINYSDIAHYINRCLEGEELVLTKDKIILYENTSGTSSIPKFIPYTQLSLLAFQKAIFSWLADLSMKYPKMMDGKAYFAISPAVRKQKYTKKGIRIGADDDSFYFGDKISRLMQHNMLDTRELYSIDDFETWKMKTAKILLNATDLSFISIWSPTFLLEILNTIHNLQPNFKVHSSWPNLALISCWTSASSAYFAKKLQGIFHEINIQGKGLISTEAIVSIPFSWATHPVLAIESNFYEFLDPNENLYRAHELKEGCSYEIIITNYSGLYRYRTNDMITVTGFYHDAPQITFTGKNDKFSDLCGEKLCEDFVIACFKEIGLDINGNCFLSIYHEPKPGYGLLFERGLYTATQMHTIANKLDLALRKNIHYNYARDLGQLQQIRFNESSFLLNQFYSQALNQGKRFGDIKLSVMIPRG